MAEQEKDRNLDQLLDSLLDSYSDVEPRPGLETRVLANLRDQAGRRKSWQWRWGWAGCVTAALTALVFIVVLERPIEPPRPVAHVVSPSVDRSDPAVTQRHHVAKKAIQPRHQEPVVAAVDKRPDRFPTPVPLSDQEKLMLRYLARTPRQEIIAQSHPDEPAEAPEPFLMQSQPPTKTDFNNSTR